MTLAEVVDRVRDAFTTRSAKVAARHAMLARHAAAVAEDENGIAAQQAKVDALDAPRRELERLKAEAANRRHREAREVAVAEGELRASLGRDLERFKARVDRLFDQMRATNRPQADVEVNDLTDVQRVRNLPEIQKWLDVG